MTCANGGIWPLCEAPEVTPLPTIIETPVTEAPVEQPHVLCVTVEGHEFKTDGPCPPPIESVATEISTSVVEVPATELAFTGNDSGLLSGVGFAFIVVGAIMTRRRKANA